MVTQATIQRHIDKGYGIAAGKLGSPVSIYRPKSPDTPISSANFVATLNSGFDIDPRFNHKQPGGYAHPIYFALADLTDLREYDYLNTPTHTYFVGAVEPLRPALVIQCNRVASVYRPATATPGPAYYGGNVTGLGNPVLRNFPCSILLGAKGERNESGLPADPRSPWHAVLLPRYADVIVKTGDLLIDDLDRRYTLSACELYLGWRLSAAYSGT